MLIFALLIVISIVFYIYYKVAILRTTDSLTQKYMNAKSRICLGAFIFFFGINQYIAIPEKYVLFISIVFVLLGVYQMYDGYKEARHYRNEYRRLHPNDA